MDGTNEKTVSRIKSPYVKQLVQFVILSACVARLAWFDGHLIVDMPDPRDALSILAHAKKRLG